MATQRKLTKETRRARRACTQKVGPSKRVLTGVYYTPEGWVATIKQGCVYERHVVAKTANNVEMDMEREAFARAEAKRILKEGR